MAKEIIFPKLGMDVSSGTLVEWFVKEGDYVKKGKPLFEVMTHKGSVEVEAETSGVLLTRIGEIDEEYPISSVIGYLGEPGEHFEENIDGFVEHLGKIEIQPQNDLKLDEKINQSSNKSEYDLSIDDLPHLEQYFNKDIDENINENINLSSHLSLVDRNRIFDGIKGSKGQRQEVEGLKKLRATPAARRLIRDENIDVKMIMPTGPKGRIQLSDVKKTISQIKIEDLAITNEPIMVKTELDTLVGHPENTTKTDKIFRVAKGQSLKELIGNQPQLQEEEEEEELVNSKKEIHKDLNPDLDFVPFVVNGSAELREEIIVKPTPIIDGEVQTLTIDKILELTRTDKNELIDEEKKDMLMGKKEKVSEKKDEPEETREVEVKEIKQAKVIPEKPFDEDEKSENKSLTENQEIITQQTFGSHSENTAITLTIEIDMSEVKDLRKRITKKIEKQSGYRCTYTDFFLMASSRALEKHPLINSRLEEERIIDHDHVSIGLAVGQENGLVVPVIKNTHTLHFIDLVKARGDMLKKTKGNHFEKEDLMGSTFTIINLGMYGVHDFTAIINPPNCGILSVGEVVQRMRILNGEPVVRSVMKASLNLDHRVADGIDGAKFLQDLKADVENPPILLF